MHLMKFPKHMESFFLREDLLQKILLVVILFLLVVVVGLLLIFRSFYCDNLYSRIIIT